MVLQQVLCAHDMCFIILKALLVAQLIFPTNLEHEASHPRRPDGRMKRAGDDCEKENKGMLITERRSSSGRRRRRMTEIKHKNFCVKEFNSIWFAEEDR